MVNANNNNKIKAPWTSQKSPRKAKRKVMPINIKSLNLPCYKTTTKDYKKGEVRLQ